MAGRVNPVAELAAIPSSPTVPTTVGRERAGALTSRQLDEPQRRAHRGWSGSSDARSVAQLSEGVSSPAVGPTVGSQAASEIPSARHGYQGRRADPDRPHTGIRIPARNVRSAPTHEGALRHQYARVVPPVVICSELGGRRCTTVVGVGAGRIAGSDGLVGSGLAQDVHAPMTHARIRSPRAALRRGQPVSGKASALLTETMPSSSAAARGHTTWGRPARERSSRAGHGCPRCSTKVCTP